MDSMKCKAWDETHKSWVDYGFCLRFDANGNGEILNAFAQPFTDGRKLVPVLWTGVEDKHGKDVYVGDIVGSDYIHYIGVVRLGEYVVMYVDDYGKAAANAYGYFVHWIQPMATIELDAGGGTVENTSALNNFVEIIGNIYEHADLLKER